MKLHITLLFITIGGFFHAQDLDRILQSKPFSHQGAVSLNTTGLFDGHSQNPLTYVLSANYTPEIFGIALPFSVMYSNQKFAYGHPFNYWRFNPSYRWIRAQFGEVNANFSPYSLSGHRFRGAAVEILPNKNWSISALYGRLNELRLADSNAQNGSFLRLGYGAKIAYTGEKYSIGGSFFKAQDIAHAENLCLLPKENVVLDVFGQWKLTSKLRISGEWASSALTQNTQDEIVNSVFKGNGFVGLFLPYRLSTAVFNAYKINIGAPFLSLGYEYVAPHYETLGAPYSNNDFENLTLNSTQKIRNFTVSGRFGVQRDNLSQQKHHRNRRLVYAANLGYGGKSRFSGQLNYSTFQTITRVEQRLSEFETTNPYAGMDTLDFRQLVQNGDLSLNVRLRETSTMQEQFLTQFSLQKTSEDASFLSSSLNYIQTRKNGKNFGFSAYIQRENYVEDKRSTVGLTAFFGAPFAKRKGAWRLTMSENIDDAKKSQLILKASASYTIWKKHQLQGQFSQQIRNGQMATMVNVSYGYTF